MAEKVRCEICDRTFKNSESLAMHNKAKHPEKILKEKKQLPVKKIRNWGIFIVVLGAIIGLIIFGISNVKTFPPTDMQGHIESNPSSHVLKEPMPIAVQKHMLEHSDGTGRPGIIINYNCKDYECENNLIENLESFASEFDYVYVAPFKGMDAKIALTKLGKIEILEEYDEDKIYIFISGIVPTNEELGTSSPDGDEENQVEETIQITDVKEFDVTAKQWQFSPDTIEVNKGDNVILNVKSIDVAHGFALPEFGIDERLSPGNEIKIEFLADKEGTFSFFCNVQCGSGHSGMSGKIIVE